MKAEHLGRKLKIQKSRVQLPEIEWRNKHSQMGRGSARVRLGGYMGLLDLTEVFSISKFRVISFFLKNPRKFMKKLKNIVITKLLEETDNNFQEYRCF